MGRNWKWFVPLIAFAAMLFFGGLVGGILFMVERTLKNSEPYHVVLNRIRTSPDVTEVLGNPLQESWFVMGNYRVQNNSRYEDLNFTITGPKGRARVYAVATAADGYGWDYRVVTVIPESTHRPISLADRRRN